MLESLFQELAKANQAAYFGNQHDSGLLVNLPKVQAEPIQPVNTRIEIAKIAGVSENTVAKVKKIEAAAKPEQKAKLQRGEVSINEVFTQIKREEKEQHREERRDENRRIIGATPPIFNIWKFKEKSNDVVHFGNTALMVWPP